MFFPTSDSNIAIQKKKKNLLSQSTTMAMSGRDLHFMLTPIQHWDVMKCLLSFEVWYPNNQQKFICTDGLTTFLGQDKALSRSKVIMWSVSQKYFLRASSHSLGQGAQYQKEIIRIE